MFTLLVTILGVLVVIGILFRVADSTGTESGTISASTPSGERTAIGR
jgi:hypothetical protein